MVARKSANTTCTLPSQTQCVTFTYPASAATASVVAGVLVNLSIGCVVQIATHVVYRSVSYRATSVRLSVDKGNP